jgi:hypothetical protein
VENDGDMLRVIDNEGEDYLYPADYFEPVQLTSIPSPNGQQVTVHLDEVTKGILQKLKFSSPVSSSKSVLFP